MPIRSTNPFPEPAFPTVTPVPPPTPEKPHLGGSVLLNNTSYSGADIKIVLTIYDGGKAEQAHIDALIEESKRVAEQLDKLDRERSRLSAQVLLFKWGSWERQRSAGALGRLLTDIEKLQRIQEDFQSRIQQMQTVKADVSTKVLAEAQSISVSTHRDKAAVRACGSVYPKAFTRGPREIAGSIVFTVFDKNVLYEMLEADPSDFDAAAGYTSALIDQLPPVDILISFANEYGSVSRMAIYGVEFIDEGQIMSIEDILTENVVHWVARDIDPMRNVSNRKVDENGIMVAQQQGFTRATSLIRQDFYQKVKEQMTPYQRFAARRNPFL